MLFSAPGRAESLVAAWALAIAASQTACRTSRRAFSVRTNKIAALRCPQSLDRARPRLIGPAGQTRMAFRSQALILLVDGYILLP